MARYRLAMPEPHRHLFRVELNIPAASEFVVLRMPSWTPGSYLLREFPRNVQEFAAETPAGEPLPWQKTDKNTWQVRTSGERELRVRYAVYANELSVRTSHLDASHGYVNGASVFLVVQGREEEPLELEIDAPPDWQSTTSLRRAGSQGLFRADNYHQLVDSPIEIGTHTLLEFVAEGKPHRYAIWGRGSYNPVRLVADTQTVIRTAARFWGGLPYEDYTFFLHLLPGSRGGLEHRDSCSLHADPYAFRGVEYEQFLALVTHEFFHTWNGTRIRPEPLAGVDYTRENYTRNLWVVEGLTTYYTDLLLRRAGLITADRYLERLSDAIHRLQTLPGRNIQSLADASFDTWIKFYRPDEHTPNSQISYYHKGALVGLLLDLRIRGATGNRRSLDDVMRLLWERYGSRDRGYPEEMADGIRAAAEEVSGESLEEFFQCYIFGTDELDYAGALKVVGLELRSETSPPKSASQRTGAGVAEPVPSVSTASAAPDVLPNLGLRLGDESGRAVVAQVLTGSAAERAGLNARDELLAVDGLRTDKARLPAVLMGKKPGDSCALTVARRGELITLQLRVGEEPPVRFRITRIEEPSAEQSAARRDWLRVEPGAVGGAEVDGGGGSP